MMNTKKIVWLNNPKISSIIPLPEKLESIPIIDVFPGASKDLLDPFISKFIGVVVVAYGSGNVSDDMYKKTERIYWTFLK